VFDEGRLREYAQQDLAGTLHRDRALLRVLLKETGGSHV
jgi:hypothetical protein